MLEQGLLEKVPETEAVRIKYVGKVVRTKVFGTNVVRTRVARTRVVRTKIVS